MLGFLSALAENVRFGFEKVDFGTQIHSNRLQHCEDIFHAPYLLHTYLVCGAMLVNLESLSLAWYLPQPGTNSWGTFVYCMFPCSTILIDVLILGPSLLPDGQMVNSSQEILLADKWPISHGDTAKLSQNICTLTCHLLQNINSLFSTFILASRLNCFIFNFLLTQLTDYQHARSSLRQCTVMTDIK